ncbi:hypothetical protein [Aeromonas cavernicola]|uniref:hypothetical protein n=1 Tax=Aeromonas cavernicola TaxID=1006623 RepID=UPI0012FD4573|nr:hypothetical protein [Aeromonas cavernicola]
MNDLVVAIIYLMFSILGVLFSFYFTKKHSDHNFKERYFWFGLVFNCLVCSFHVGVWKVGFNPFIPATEAWLKGNIFVGWLSLLFAIPQAIYIPKNNNHSASGYKRDGNK